MVFLNLLHNITLLVSLSLIYSLVARRWKVNLHLLRILSGVAFGGVAIVAMLTPVQLFPGVILDGRTMILCIAGLIGGSLTAGIAAVIAIVFRFHLGGTGALIGAAMIVEAGSLGVAYHHLRLRYPQKTAAPLALYALGLLVHVIVVLLAMALPAEMAMTVFSQIWLPVILIFPLATLMVALLYIQGEAQRLGEQALQESEEKYRQLVDNAREAIYVLQNGTIVFANGMFARMLSLTPSEAVGRTIYDYLPEDERARFKDHEDRLLRGQAVDEPLELRVVMRDSEHWVSLTAVRILWHGAPATLNMAADITARKRAEAERLELERRLLHAQKLESLGVLAGGIAHDFNNLLAAILGNLELALMDLAPTENVRISLEGAAQAARRAADLTRQMLAYSGKGQFIVGPVNLSELVRENAHLLNVATPKSVTLDLRLDPHLPAILADAGQMQQVVMNLITNAVEAIGERPGAVVVSTGVQECDEPYLSHSRTEEKPAPGRYVWLEVRDTGCGMDTQTQQRLFDPFYTTKMTGRGLGMSAVLGIVRGHRGAILVESAPGQGTTIRVLFPPAANKAGQEAGVGPRPLPKLTGTVLVVDDEEMVRSFCRKMVERLGCTVLLAADGVEAVALYRAHAEQVGCIILDLTMPGPDGVETLAALRQIRADVPVIISSGYSEQAVSQQFAQTKPGPARFIHKPYNVTELRAALEQALRGQEHT